MAQGRPISYVDTLPPIEVFATADNRIVGDGVTDDSVAIKAAHDAAYAMGLREVYCSKQYYAPTAYNLGQVIFRGPGRLLGTYRKKVIPFSARAIGSLAPRINPAIHLKRFSRAVNPVVVIWGDSTSTVGADRISPTETLWAMLQRAIKRDNPGKTITWYNRAIGGTTIQNFNDTGTSMVSAGITLPSWFSNPAAPWSGWIDLLSPDLVIINWGANDGDAVNTVELAALASYLQGLAKVPDLLISANLPRSTQTDAGSAMVEALESTDFAAGTLRSFAEFNGYGLLDFHRVGCMMRDGFDPCTQVMNLDEEDETYNLPASLPMTDGDFNLVFTIDNTGGAAFGAGQALDISLSPQAGNSLRIDKSGSIYRLIGFAAGGAVWLGATGTAINLPSAPCKIDVAVRGSWLTLSLDNTLAYEGPCLRHGGRFQPAVSYAVGSGATSIEVLTYVNSSPALVQPAITDGEMFGVSPFPEGGNAINHPASEAYEAIHAAVIDQMNFCAAAAGPPVQSITAAAAINADAALVGITGPAASTYAITLAAPRVQDKGRTLVIEMLSTTSTNAVTLALTNVVGGTASSSASFDAAGERLVLIGGSTKWEVLDQNGVTLS